MSPKSPRMELKTSMTRILTKRAVCGKGEKEGGQRRLVEEREIGCEEKVCMHRSEAPIPHSIGDRHAFAPRPRRPASLEQRGSGKRRRREGGADAQSGKV